MPTATSSRRIVYLDADQDPDFEAAAAPEAAGFPASDEADASLCASCGEPLTWHEQPCLAITSADASAGATETVAAAPATRRDGFEYALGHLVVPATQQQAHPVVWRGQLRERSASTGLVHRTNVYRLGDGFWDCYREEELRAA